MTYKYIRLATLVMFASVFFTCSSNTVLNVLVIDEKGEQKIGKEFDTQLRADPTEYPLFKPGTDPKKVAFKAYIDSVFGTIIDAAIAATPESERLDYLSRSDFTFTIIDKDVVNAFAVPGGYVYIYTGIMKAMNDESELAGVLGHELAHVQRRHYAKSQVKGALVGALADAVAGDDAGALTTAVKNAFGLLSGTYISREHEAESDKYGTTYLGTSGRNPHGIATFFGRMENSNIGWISTHPQPTNRVIEVNKQIDASTALKATDTEALKFEARYTANVAAIK